MVTEPLTRFAESGTSDEVKQMLAGLGKLMLPWRPVICSKQVCVQALKRGTCDAAQKLLKYTEAMQASKKFRSD